MKVSELPLPVDGGRALFIETDTDSLRIVGDEYSRKMYIDQFGDVETVYDAKTRWYRVPAFDAQRKEYNDFKTRDCAIWGNE
jgi:hypothetical protein